jgi:hypothetical protein
MVDQPTPQHRVLIGKIRQRRQRLANETFSTIRPLLCGDGYAFADQRERVGTIASFSPNASRNIHSRGYSLKASAISRSVRA